MTGHSRLEQQVRLTTLARAGSVDASLSEVWHADSLFLANGLETLEITSQAGQEMTEVSFSIILKHNR